MKIKYLTSESLSKVSDFLNKGTGFEQFIKTDQFSIDAIDEVTGNTILHYIMGALRDPEVTNKEECALRRIAMSSSLAENYAKLNSINLDGKTPLDIFCDNKEYWGNRYLLYKSDLEDLGYKTRDFLDSYYSEIYKVILEQGMALPKRFVVEDIISFCDSNGNNLLHILFQHSKKIQHDVVDKALFLMNDITNINCLNKEGKTPLDIFCENGDGWPGNHEAAVAILMLNGLERAEPRAELREASLNKTKGVSRKRSFPQNEHSFVKKLTFVEKLTEERYYNMLRDESLML
jgi:hypothetical protein